MTNKRLNRLFNVAIKELTKSTYRHQMGAVIFDGNKVISRGYNKTKTHPWLAKHNEWATTHAECDAIIKSRVDLRGCSIFVARNTAGGKIALAKPCVNCQRILVQVGITEVYYTTGEFPFYEKMELELT